MTPLATTAGAWLETEIVQLTTAIWEATLGLAIEPIAAFPEACAAQPGMDGLVTISGDWHGAVAVQMPVPLTRIVAGIMFRLDASLVSADDVVDAIGEITNQTGGNVKSLMPRASTLSLPTVTPSQGYALPVPDLDVSTRVVFACGDSAFVVTLLAQKSGATL
jgi:hypothetical protein